MLAVAPTSNEMIESLVTQGIGMWRDFLLQEVKQTVNYQRQLSASLTDILQSLHALVSANYNRSSFVDGRCWYRLQAFCYMIKGVSYVVTLTSSTVMSPTSHEQMVTLRQAGDRDSTDTSMQSGPLQDLQTIPLPRSLFTAHHEEQPISAPDAAAVDTRWLAVDILEQMKNKDSSLANSDSVDNSASMLCIETARIRTELFPSSSSSLSVIDSSRGCNDSDDVDCFWAHGVLAMLHDVLQTTIPTNTNTAAATDASVVLPQLSVRRRVPVLSSAAVVAMLSTALHLVDRPLLPSQALGSMVLWELLACHSSSSLLLSMGTWLLPLLFKATLSLPSSSLSSCSVDDNNSSVGYHPSAVTMLVHRLLQVVVIACSSTPSGLHHAHLLLQRSTHQISLSLNPFSSWPLLLALKPFLSFGCPVAVLRCQLFPLVDTLLALVNRWHAPVQVICFQLLLILCNRCCCNILSTVSDSHENNDEDVTTANVIVPRVVVEMLRVQMFLQAGDVADLSGSTGAASVGPSGDSGRAVVSSLQELLSALALHFQQRHARLWAMVVQGITASPGPGTSPDDDAVTAIQSALKSLTDTTTMA